MAAREAALRHGQEPTAERQRDAALRRPRDDDALARGRVAARAGRRLHRRAAGHRHLQPRRRALRAATDPRRVGAAAALQHGHRRRAVRHLAGGRPRRRADQHLLDRQVVGDRHALLRQRAGGRLQAADPRRRPHDRAADPARHREEARAGGAGARRCARRHQRRDVRRAGGARHAVSPRGRRRPARLRQGLADRPARHGLCGRRLRLAALAGLHGRAGARGLVSIPRAADGAGA